MRRPRKKRMNTDGGDIDITAFLNLMVVLIPFLLLSAAFNQYSILDLYLPDKDATALPFDEPPEKLELQLVLRSRSVVIADGNEGDIASYDVAEDGSFDIAGVKTRLANIKDKYRDETSISILSEPDISYERIVLAMDTVRTVTIEDDQGIYQAELFPDISLGAAEMPGTDESDS